ncbi:MAG TPA: transglutaminase domain-containing protein [bacterium]|nr:transglutaminase domain-containing protein [bacterium]
MDETRLGQTTELAETTSADFDSDARLTEILRGDWRRRLETESYEEAAESLGELQALREWRRETHQSQFSSFYQLFESASALNRSHAAGPELVELRQTLADRLIQQSRHLPPRVSDLYQAFLAEVDGSRYTAEFESTETKIQELKESGDLDLLLDGNTPYAIKANRIKTRLEGDLRGRAALDRRDRAKEKIEQVQTPDSRPQTPPAARNQSKPGMDEMERSKEGETPPAIWTISPAYGGYFKEQSFDSWNTSTNTWHQSSYQTEELSGTDLQYFDPDREKIVLQATLLPGQPVRLPVPYTFDLAETRRDRPPYTIARDQNGDYIITLSNTEHGPTTVEILMQESSPFERGNLTGKEAPKAGLRFELQALSTETLERLREIHKTKKGNLAKARAVAGWTMRRLKYSNDSSFNQTYDTDPKGYIAAIDEHRQADCDVANTYFAGLCSALGIPVRHVVGHMVKGKDDKGDSRITSGTGHAWSEVWDDAKNEWVRIDATPAGDPQLEDQEKSKGEAPPGDYGEQEAVGPTDEQLAELEEKLANLTEQLSYSSEERELAEAAGVELSEARQIVKEIAEAEDTRLPGGKRVVDLLSQLFSLIIESRRAATPDYTGPLRKREGGEEIDDIVAHKIGIRSGETDPRSRQQPYERVTVEQVFGGFDVYMIGDKSGSMGQTVDGEAKWRLQRRAQYLILSPLHRIEQNLERTRTQMGQPLSLRSETISFRNSAEIDVDKPLSDSFSPADKVKIWRSLGNQGVGNGDVAALTHIYEQIKAEREAIEQQGVKDDRLRIVIACSDGGPDSVAGVHQLAQQLGELNAVVVGLGLTETAAAVPVIFNTPYSRGEMVKDINHLPAVVAKQIIIEAIKLFPEKSKQSAERIIEGILDKFKQID